jgi:hypothetical protein
VYGVHDTKENVDIVGARERGKRAELAHLKMTAVVVYAWWWEGPEVVVLCEVWGGLGVWVMFI